MTRPAELATLDLGHLVLRADGVVCTRCGARSDPVGSRNSQWALPLTFLTLAHAMAAWARQHQACKPLAAVNKE